MPDELAAQIPLVHRACEALGVPIITHERYEADDVIGTMTERAVAAGLRRGRSSPATRTSFSSCATASASSTRGTKARWYDAAGVKEKFGVAPDQVVDVLALMGDTIDNVKGVPGHRREGRARI